MRNLFIKAISAVFLVLILVSGASAATENVKYTWTEPPNGTKPVLYRVEMQFAADPEQDFSFWTEMKRVDVLFYVLEQESDLCYRVRVRAQDAEGRLGPYSFPSIWECGDDVEGDPETSDLGPADPGQPKLK